MIRYTAYGSSNYRTPITYYSPRDLLAVKYEELLELREQVRKAEAQIPKRSADVNRSMSQCR